jgi:hypothetical protein
MVRFVIIVLLSLLSAKGFGAVGDNREVVVNSETSINTDKASSPPAALIAAVCQSGFSAQAIEGGFTVMNADAFCDLIRLSEVMLNASKVQAELGNNEYALMYDGYYHQALQDANELVSRTEYTALLDRLFSDMLVPLLIIIGLVLLL